MKAGASLCQWQRVPQQRFDRAQLITILKGHKTCGSPSHLHSSCPSNTMDIVFRAVWHIIIDHVANIGYIYSPGSNIRRNKNSDLPSFKSVESAKALRQTSVSMNDRNTMTGLFKRLTESINPTLCPGEYQDCPSFCRQQRYQQLRFFLRTRMMYRLRHTFSRG
jgi:hypothetical protein